MTLQPIRNAGGRATVTVQPTVCARAWLEWDGRNLLGRGRGALLEHIDRLGSISSAARAMGVSYRAAWKWIAAMNSAVGSPLVETLTGGRGGGGARLTVTGRTLLEAYQLLATRLADFQTRVASELASVLDVPERPRKRRTPRR